MYYFSVTNKQVMLLTLTVVVIRARVLLVIFVVVVFFCFFALLWNSTKICALLYYVPVERVLTFALSWQTGIILLVARSLMKSP